MGWRRRRSDVDFRREIDAHLALETDRLIEEGLAPAEARDAAARRFGNATAVHERFYESSRLMWIDHLRQDLRSGARGLVRYPLACLVAVLSLGAGIGSTTALLTIRNVIFDNPPPLYADPESLSKVYVSSPGRAEDLVAAGLYAAWADDAALGARMAAAARGRTADLRADTRREPVTVRPVTPDLFDVLGVPPALGRSFSSRPLQDREVVLSHGVWRDLFAARPDVVGLELWLDDRPHTVIGVMPARFWYSRMDAPVWTALDVRSLGHDDRLDVVARAHGNLAGRLQRGLHQYVAGLPADQQEIRVRVPGIAGTEVGTNVGPAAMWLLAAPVVLTMLIACSNVAVLLIAQWSAREHEIAIRASIGAGRGRLVRALLAESVLLAIAGGTLGIGVTLALLHLIARNAGESPFFDLSMSPAVLAQSSLLAILTGLATGLAPALFETRRLRANPLRLVASIDRVRQRWQHALVVCEITATVSLLVVTGTLVSAYLRTVDAAPGFDTRPLLTARVESPAGAPIEAVVDRLRSMPGVVEAAATTAVPLVRSQSPRRAASRQDGGGSVVAQETRIGSRFFETLGVPVVAGRVFSPSDSRSPVEPVVINAALASRLWPVRSPVGESLAIDGTSHQVIGVVGDYATAVLQRRQPLYFLPVHESEPANLMQFLVRAADPASLARPVRRGIRELDPVGQVSVFVVVDAVQVGGREILITTYPMVPLIATAMLLTAAGIYGVLAFAVTRRARELAVHVAIGASSREVVRLVTSRMLRLVAVGTSLGVLATFAVVRTAQGTGGVFDSPGWQAFAIPIALLLVVAAAATWIPVRRALRMNPATLLRAS